jgi:hypothetical protein
MHQPVASPRLQALFFIIVLMAWAVVYAKLARAHDWYVGQRDPVTKGGCCTTSATAKYGDCAELRVEPGVLEPIPEGYRVRLTVEQARKINPLRNLPVDTIVPESRIQDSEDGNFHMCIPAYPSPNMQADFFCFFRPGSM